MSLHHLLPMSLRHTLSIPRDKQGRFRVEGLVPGLKYHLVLLGGGIVEQEVTVKEGETKDLGNVIVNPIK